MVWFYPIGNYEWTAFGVFQSHYGLILSRRVHSIQSATPHFDFQSHYGLILSFINLFCVIELWSPFNPTMVWFYLEAIWKEIAEIKTLSIPLWSDFIVRKNEGVCVNPPHPAFSGGRGCGGVAEGTWRQCSFQSHYGLILSLKSLRKMATQSSFNPTMVWFYPD